MLMRDRVVQHNGGGALNTTKGGLLSTYTEHKETHTQTYTHTQTHTQAWSKEEE